MAGKYHPVKWGRPKSGYCDSKDGAWRICPLYFGSTRPRSFELREILRDGDVKHHGWFDTQFQAKEAADRLVRSRLRRLLS